MDNLWIFGKPSLGEWDSWIYLLQAFKQFERLERSLDVIAANMHKTDGAWAFERGSTCRNISKINCYEGEIEGTGIVAAIWKES